MKPLIKLPPELQLLYIYMLSDIYDITEITIEHHPTAVFLEFDGEKIRSDLFGSTKVPHHDIIVLDTI